MYMKKSINEENCKSPYNHFGKCTLKWEPLSFTLRKYKSPEVLLNKVSWPALILLYCFARLHSSAFCPQISVHACTCPQLCRPGLDISELSCLANATGNNPLSVCVCVWGGYTWFCTLHGFMHTLGVLDHVPLEQRT